MDIHSLHEAADLVLYVFAALVGAKLGVDAYCLFRGYRLDGVGIATTLISVISIVVTVVTFHPEILASPMLGALIRAVVIGMILGGGLTYVFDDDKASPDDKKKED